MPYPLREEPEKSKKKKAPNTNLCECNQKCILGNCLNANDGIECDEGNCLNAKSCENRRFSNQIYAKIELFLSENYIGVRALEKIPKDKFVIEFVGEIIDRSELRKRDSLKDHYYWEDGDCYAIEDDERGHTIIDPARKGSLIVKRINLTLHI